MRLASSCVWVAVMSMAATGAADVNYCPIQLIGQYGNSYYYQCQTDEGGSCTYKYAMVGTPYQCGGCLPECCSDMCKNGFSLLSAEQPAQRRDKEVDSARAADPNDSEVVPARSLDGPTDKREDFATANERFCAAKNTFPVDEVWVQIVDSKGKPYYFRCFDVVFPDWPDNKLRVGRQIRTKTWNDGPVLTNNAKRSADRDDGWARKTSRFHRVTVNDPMAAAGDRRVFYLISVDDIE